MSGGDDSAASRLLPLVYDDLRALAGSYLRGERADHTLQPTALVHEAYLRLVDHSQIEWKGRLHFMAVAATAMRRVLIDHARKHRAAKRGGKGHTVNLARVGDPKSDEAIDLVVLDDTLSKLAETDERLYRMVELRFFGGLTNGEIADLLSVSVPTIERQWRLARAWLSAEFRKSETKPQMHTDKHR